MNARQLIGVAIALCVPLSAYAYVDPGSGMLIWQGLIALVGAVLVFVRQPVETFKRMIKRIRRK